VRAFFLPALRQKDRRALRNYLIVIIDAPNARSSLSRS